MKRVSFRVTYPEEVAHPIHRHIMRENGISRGELSLWGPTANVTTLSWYDAGKETVEELLSRIEAVSTVALVKDSDGTYAFVHQTDFEMDDDVLELVFGSNVVFLPPVTFFDSGDATFEAVGEPSSLSEFHGRLAELLDTRIELVTNFRRGTSTPDLTERQRVALESAVAAGYYDVPRTASVADIATELECAPSTAGELLRKAESSIIVDLVQKNSRARGTRYGEIRK